MIYIFLIISFLVKDDFTRLLLCMYVIAERYIASFYDSQSQLFLIK